MNKPAFDPSKLFAPADMKPAFDPSQPSQDINEDYQGVIKNALNESFAGRGSKIRDLMTNPETMAKVIPYITPIAMTMTGAPWAATRGMAAGRALSDVALKALGKENEIPSVGQHALEGALSIGSDLTAIPAIKSKIGSSMIGQAESWAGLANIEKEAPPSGMRTAVKYVQNLKNKLNTAPLSIEEARAAKPALDTIFRRGWLNNSEYMSDLAQVKSRVTGIINQVPGRAEGAAIQASGMAAPNTVANVGKAVSGAVPWWLKVAGTVLGGDALIRALAGRK